MIGFQSTLVPVNEVAADCCKDSTISTGLSNGKEKRMLSYYLIKKARNGFQFASADPGVPAKPLCAGAQP
jgi:hypothetical protein